MVIKKIKSKTNTFYFAHRGAQKIYSENTLKSFQKAIELGCDGIEMDIQITKDEKIIIFHDFDIALGKNQHFISQLTYQEIISLCKAKKITPPDLFDSVIPLMSKNPDIIFNIEIKSQAYNNFKIINFLNHLLSEPLMQNQCIFSSVNPFCLIQLKAHIGKKVFIGIVLGSKRMKNNPNSILNKIIIKCINPQFLHPNANYLNLELVDWAHANNMLVSTYTVNSRVQLEEMKKLGVDGVFTDNHNFYLK